MKTFCEWLNEISQVGKVYFSNAAYPHVDQANIIGDIYLSVWSLRDVINLILLDPRYKKQVEPVSNDINNIFDRLTADKKDKIRLNASEVYSLKEFLNKIINATPPKDLDGNPSEFWMRDLVRHAKEILNELERTEEVAAGKRCQHCGELMNREFNKRFCSEACEKAYSDNIKRRAAFERMLRHSQEEPEEE